MASAHKGLTRRNLLAAVGMVGAGAMLAGCSNGTDANKSVETDVETQKSTPVELTVFDPSGSTEISQLHAPRLDTLDGKTIAFVSDDAWEDHRMFPLLKELFAEQYPNTTIIPQDNFIHGIDALTVENNGLPEAMQEKNVDGVIVGNAG